MEIGPRAPFEFCEWFSRLMEAIYVHPYMKVSKLDESLIFVVFITVILIRYIE